MRGLTAVMLVLAASGHSAGAQAQSVCDGSSCPTTFQIAEKPIAPVPTTFKFQTRISQGKIPVGDALFKQIIVNLRDGVDIKCQETHTNVRVKDSVLNLEIGASWNAPGNCQLDDVIASSSGLNFQICIGNGENCLDPVGLSSVPFATKANFAAQTQEAHRADVAAQCHYAHRVTADTSLFVTQKIGEGYYDFHTPTSTDMLAINAQSVEGGFIQWTPVNPEHSTLHICQKDNLSNKLTKLSELMLHAGKTLARGDVETDGGLWVDGDKGANVTANLTVGQSATIAVDTTVGRDLKVFGAGHVYKEFTADGASLLNSTLKVIGDTNLQAKLGVVGATALNGGATIQNSQAAPNLPSLSVFGSSGFHGDIVADNNFSLAGNLAITGTSKLSGAVTIENNLTVNQKISTNTLNVRTGAIDVQATGPVRIGTDGMLVQGSTNLQKDLEVFGTTTFHGTVNLPSDIAMSITLAPNTVNSSQITNGEVKGEDTRFAWKFYSVLNTTQVVQARVCFASSYVNQNASTANSCTSYPGNGGSIPADTTFTGDVQNWTIKGSTNVLCTFLCMLQ